MELLGEVEGLQSFSLEFGRGQVALERESPSRDPTRFQC
jgi:hypothetical protein